MKLIDASIVGVGASRSGRRLGYWDLALTTEACTRAVDDAGLQMADIDGLATYPGWTGGTAVDGYSGPGTLEVQEALRLELDWFSGSREGAAQLQAISNAAMAVTTGLARNVLVYRTVTESTAQRGGHRRPMGDDAGVIGPYSWYIPFGAVSAVNWAAWIATAHFARYGTTREQLGALAINQRLNASTNEEAIYRDLLTMDDYLAARMISTPLCLYDCDVPADGSVAFVVSSSRAACDAPSGGISIEAVGTAIHTRGSWDQMADLTEMAAKDAADSMWRRTDLRPSDVDVAELYDGFSILALLWLEALGFCGAGEGGPFVESGQRIGLGGSLPVNTAGGQLSAGRLHGFGLLREACLQLRGAAGSRQVHGARVAVVSNGGGPDAGCLLLSH